MGRDGSFRFPVSLYSKALRRLKNSCKRYLFATISSLNWMGARVVDWARLESVCTARYRGFESLPIRFMHKLFVVNSLHE
jgi:hypothetical protein